jgi:DMSO reductase anchor subunit
VTTVVLIPSLRPFAVAAGCIGIFSSARIYMVPARPAWNSWRTPAEFMLTALILSGHPVAMPAAALGQVALQVSKLAAMRRSSEFELRQSARLLTLDFRWLFIARLALLAALPWIPATASMACALASELAGRYLFFVTVVPRNMATTFFGTAREAR